jgi:hypothetical protein
MAANLEVSCKGVSEEKTQKIICGAITVIYRVTCSHELCVKVAKNLSDKSKTRL